jgi:hypothetical protein
MELFKPSKKMLEFICKDEKFPLTHYEIYPFADIETMYELYLLGMVGLFEKIRNYYRKKGLVFYEKGFDRLDIQGISNLVGEIFKNWGDHCPENSKLLIGYFFGNSGIGYGFQDGGEFFKNPEIKKQIENKVLFKKFDKNSRGKENNCNCGFNDYIYSYSDFLEVDTEKGIFYVAQLKENMIAPEGKNGSDYCWRKRKEKDLVRG